MYKLKNIHKIIIIHSYQAAIYAKATAILSVCGYF